MTFQCLCGKSLEVYCASDKDVDEVMKQHGWQRIAGTATMALCRACATATTAVKEIEHGLQRQNGSHC